MMAKMFYTAEETQQALGRSPEDIKQLTREGRLREFRDGPRVMYKADQVENLRSELGLGGAGDTSGPIDLGPSDSAGPLGLADSASGTSSGTMIGLADSGGGMSLSKDDTATDIGLSNTSTGIGLSSTSTGIPLAGSLSGGSLAGSMGGPGAGGASSGGSLGGSMGGSRAGSLAGTRAGSGVNVLGLEDSAGGADPSAQTAVTQSFGDQVNLEAMGSGSGLLDLSRERDDTSLGEPVLGEIESGSRTGPAVTGGPIVGGGVAGVRGAPMVVEAADPMAPAFAGAALGASVIVIVALIALAAGVGGGGVANSLIAPLATHAGENAAQQSANPWFYTFGAGVVLSVIGFVVGLLFGRKG